MTLIFVDCEAVGPCPRLGHLTQFGAVEYASRESFYGLLWPSKPDPTNPAKSIITGEPYDPATVFEDFSRWLGNYSAPYVFVSDNPAYDWQWINDGFWRHLGRNPFGHSARRIGDYYAGLTRRWSNTQEWKRWRVTPHDHHPVHDAMGNVEAFSRLGGVDRYEEKGHTT